MNRRIHVHAVRKVLECAASLPRWSASRVRTDAGVQAVDALNVDSTERSEQSA
jgi:hypothetical protein